MALENILSQEIVQKMGWTLLHFVWQAATVALLLGILLALLRKSSANLRYIVACAALGLIVLLPIATMQLVPVSAPQPTTNIEMAPAPSILSAQEFREIPAVEMTVPEGPVQHENAGTGFNASWKQRAADLLEPALPYIVSAWLLGVFGLSLWHLGGWAQLQRLRKKMVKQVDDSLHNKLRRLSERLRVKRAVQLAESALVQVPTVVGWLRPVILLPASALTGLSSEQLEALLAHELAHIRRHDYLVNMLQTVVETLGFYHPAVWWVSHKIRIERENCCDDLAVSLSGDRIRYAKALTSMEEIRGRRSGLAVAAAGGNLFGRIRRLVGKDSNEPSRTSWIPSVITIMLIAIIVIPTTLALTGQSENKSDADIETLLINGFRENRDKFKSGVLAWSMTNRIEGFEGRRTETKGTFQLWWDGKKITTKYAQECTDLDADIVTDKREGGNIYDGKFLSRKPRFEPLENWFGGQITRWTGPMSVDQEIPALRKRRNVEMDFSTVTVDSRELIKLSTKNIDKATVDFGAYSIRYFDPSKGYGLVNKESYTADNRLRSRFSLKLMEVIPDGWFPVDVEVKGLSLKDGKVYLQRHLALDLERCRFNDPSAIPYRIFDFSANKEHEQLNNILKKFSDGTTVDKSSNNSKSIRESVENYIAAALAGEDEKAAEYAYPDTTVAAQTKDIRKALQDQNMRIVGLCIGEWNSLAISSVIQADHGRTGSIVFHLKKMILDQKVHWLIDNIDLETLDTIGKQIHYFINNVPDAKTIIINPNTYANKQTDVPVEAKFPGEGVLMLEGFYSFGEGEMYSKRLSRIFKEAQILIKQISSGHENRDWNAVSQAAIQVRDIFLGLKEALGVDDDAAWKAFTKMWNGEKTDENEVKLVDLARLERTLEIFAFVGGEYHEETYQNLCNSIVSIADVANEIQKTLRIKKPMMASPLIEKLQANWSTLTEIDGIERLLHSEFKAKEKSDVPVEEEGSRDNLPVEESAVNNSRDPLLAKSAAPSAEDKSVVRIDLLVVEVFPGLKMDRETTIAARNLLGPIFVSSTDTADLLKKAAGATAAVKDESASDKRVTQEMFKVLVDMMISKGYVKILMRPTLEVFDGHTAKVMSTDDSIEITPTVRKDGNIILQVEATLSSLSMRQGKEQTPIVSRREISTRIRLSPGESGIIGGMKQAGLLTEPDKATKDSEVPATEMLVILTPTIVETAGNQQEGSDIKDEATVNKEYEVVLIRYADVMEVAKHINKALQQMPEKELRESVFIQPLERTRQIIIFGRPDMREMVKKLIAEIDKQPGIGKATIMIDTRILKVDEDFLNDIGLDANSIGDVNVAPEPLILDDHNVDLLLKAVQSRKDYRLLSRQKILATEGKQAEIAVVSEAYFIEVVYEPNDSSETPITRIEKLQFGTFIKLTPELMPDTKNIALDLEIEVRRLGDFEQDKYKGEYPYEIPPFAVIRNKMRIVVSDGNTLPIVGQRIAKPVLLTQQEALWGNWSPIRGVFPKSSSIEESGRLLILVKPSIEPNGKADI